MPMDMSFTFVSLRTRYEHVCFRIISNISSTCHFELCPIYGKAIRNSAGTIANDARLHRRLHGELQNCISNVLRYNKNAWPAND